MIEIRTPSGLGYAQYASRDTVLGPQLRVLPGIFAQRPNIEALAKQKALYYIHFPLGAAASRGLVKIVGNAAVPDSAQAENDLFRIQAIWNDTLLAERIAEGWRPT